MRLAARDDNKVALRQGELLFLSLLKHEGR